MNRKKYTDSLAMLLTLFAIVTGFILHRQVHHLFVYNNTSLWCAHEAVGLALTAFVIAHCFQHKPWFKNFSKIKLSRKWLNSCLLLLAVMTLVSGIVLLCGSHSRFVSIFHYITAIAFTLGAIVHVVNRRKLLLALFRR